MLYRYCEAQQVGHRHIGKLVVASQQADISKLKAIERQARLNGLLMMSAFSMLPRSGNSNQNVIGAGALWSPSTGIVDSHQLMMALQAEIETASGMVVLNSKVTNLVLKDGGLQFDAGGRDVQMWDFRERGGIVGYWFAVAAQAAPTNKSPAAVPRQGLPTTRTRGSRRFRHLVYPLPFDGRAGNSCDERSVRRGAIRSRCDLG